MNEPMTASGWLPRRRLRFPATPVAGLAGTSFKHEHLPAILADRKQRGFFEVHAENYMGAGGPPHRALEPIRRDHPVSLHGVCMSIGGPQPLDRRISRASARSSNATSRRWSPSISPGRRTRPPTSTTCCRCPTPRRRSTTSAITSTRCRRRSAGRSCSRIRRPMSSSRNRR